MPESPEVWFLGLVLNKMRVTNRTYGKHLLLYQFPMGISESSGEDWSFGLSGTVRWNMEHNRLVKVDGGGICGSIKPFDDPDMLISSLGLDFMMATITQADVEDVIRECRWSRSKRQLGTLLLDQSMIAGIGVAWGSEILHHAHLRPDVKACEQDLSTLAASCIHIRDQVRATYLAYLDQAEAEAEAEEGGRIKRRDKWIDMINGWFHNLYDQREMQVYQKGHKVRVSGRHWWV